MNTGPVYTRDSYSPIGPVGYDDWESDPAHELIIHTATGCTFALEPFPSFGVRFFGMRDSDQPPDAEALLPRHAGGALVYRVRLCPPD